MSWTHTTEGFEAYSAFLSALETVGIPYEEGEHGEVFTTLDNRRMVVEPYLSVDDGDCDGTSRIDIAVYELGQRPRLYTKVFDSGMDNYEGVPVMPDGYPAGHFRYCINDGVIDLADELEDDRYDAY